MAENGFEFAMSENREICRLYISTKGVPEVAWPYVDVDAETLSTALLNLSNIRSKMSPAIPKKLDPGRPIFKDSTFSPPVMVGDTKLPVTNGKSIFLAFRHAGYGWLAIGFTIPEARALMGLLAENILRVEPKAIDRRIILP